jgi:transcriptional regulator with XRE-family HTH domain
MNRFRNKLVKRSELRRAKNMSIEALSIECKLDYSRVNSMELGKVNFGMAYLKEIATVLGIEAWELLP